MTPTLPPPIWVDTPSGLRKLIEALSREPRIAVDTESNSLHAYREQTCLIQFSTPRQDYLLDPLAIHDLTWLAPIFADPAIQKVFHAAEYDIHCLQRDFQFTFANLFDTMIAARTLGYTTTGLGGLIKEKFDIELDKRYQKADWGQRPLKQEMLDYARHDTCYLLALSDLLSEELREKGRLDLAREDFVRACEPLSASRDLRARWERISGVQDLSPRAQTILSALADEREKLAERRDRPVFKIVGDKTLLELAKNPPRSFSQLSECGLTERQVLSFGRHLLEAVRRGEKAPLVEASQGTRPSDALANRLQRLKQWRKKTAESLKVESDVVLSRTHMELIAEKSPATLEELATLMEDSPWRFEAYGEQILKALGKRK
jgi:ribonuclease D